MPFPTLTWKVMKGLDQDGVPWTQHHTFSGTVEEVYADCQTRASADFPDGDYTYQPKGYWDIGMVAGGAVIPTELFAGTLHQVGDRMTALATDPGGEYTASGKTDSAP